jgi:DegV family protein with EDD domain
MTVAIVTDSAASLAPEIAAEAAITVVPMWLTIGGRQYRDGELSLEEVVGRLDEGVTTSGPSPGEIAEAVQGADGGDGVLVLTIAQAMSSTHQAARTAVGIAGESARALDTRTAAGAEGLVVLAAARRAAAGGSLDEVEAAAREAIERVRLVASVPNLDQLAKSGRVPGAAAWAGRWLGLNPLFEFKDGKVRPQRPARSRSSAMDRIVSSWRDSIDRGAQLHVAAVHALDPAAADDLLDAVRKEVDPATELVGSFSPVMVAHTGPGLVGLAWWWEDR